MEELSNFHKQLKQLSAPYKLSKEYKYFANNKNNKSNKKNISSFWDAEMGYVAKYETIDLKKKSTK